MKYIVCIIIGLFLSIVSVFAETSITINSSDTSADISEIIELRIEIQSDIGEAIGNIAIPGMENFNIIGQSASQSVRTSGNISTSNTIIIFTVKARQSGNYTLGPIELEGNQSNSVDIEITGSDILIGGQLDTLTTPPTTDEETIDENNDTTQEDDKKIQQSQDIESILSGNLVESGSGELADIYGPKYIFPFSLKNNLVYIIFLALAYFGYKIYTQLQKSKILAEKQRLEQEALRVDYHMLLETLEKKYITAEKTVFYNQIATVFRQYLDERIEKGLSTKTLEEVRSKLQNKEVLASLYEKIYYPEYNTVADNENQRHELIVSLKHELI